MQEKRLKVVPLQNFATNGTSDGKFTLSDASLFKVKQKVVIIATSLPNLELEVKKVEEDGVTIHVGPIKASIDSRSDLSLYTTALAAAICSSSSLDATILASATDFSPLACSNFRSCMGISTCVRFSRNR